MLSMCISTIKGMCFAAYVCISPSNVLISCQYIFRSFLTMHLKTTKHCPVLRYLSATVQKGDRVEAGMELAKSGAVGFVPTPHLHVAVMKSSADNAPTARFAFLSSTGEPYFPKSGKWYRRSGPISVDESRT